LGYNLTGIQQLSDSQSAHMTQSWRQTNLTHRSKPALLWS